MTKHLIPFTAPEILALQAGRKTQHRVPVEPSFVCPDHGADCPDPIEQMADGSWTDGFSGYRECVYRKGDRIIVQEEWSANEDGDVVYRADPDSTTSSEWSPAWSMAAWASRYTLELTADERVERLAKMTWKEAFLSGYGEECKHEDSMYGACSDCMNTGVAGDDPTHEFKAHWDAVNPNHPFDTAWARRLEFRKED